MADHQNLVPDAVSSTWHTLMNQAPRKISILGSTGSIGTQAIDVVRQARQQTGCEIFSVVALTAGNSSIDVLAQQAVETSALMVGTSGNSDDAQRLRERIAYYAEASGRKNYQPEIVYGSEASVHAAKIAEADVVLNAITGSIGLIPTLEALKAHKMLALANKESLVAGGALIHQALQDSICQYPLVPVDSEHSALAQALRSGTQAEVSRLILTASGGPFRGCSRSELKNVTPADALAHPTWDMGLMVTTNSATMVNKALEVLEAHLLFNIPLEKIDVVVHPQSVVHSMVEFVDGSTITQASPPDMRLPIALGLSWPHRVPGVVPGCDWSQATSWEFQPLDQDVFPAVNLIKQAVAQGPTAPAVFNAANEQAVLAFHAGKIGFLQIVDTVAQVVEEHVPCMDLTVETVLEAEQWARARTDQLVAR